MASEPYYVSPGDRLTAGWMNAVVGAVKRRNNSTGRKLQFAGGQGQGDCPFGEIYLDDSVNPAVQKIRGGVVICGDKNFVVPGYDVKIDNDRKVWIFLRIPLTVNIDDDRQILLPGIDTSDWTPKMEEAPNTGDGSGFPNTTHPEVPTATGELIIPLGNLTVDDKIATYSPETLSCGTRTCDHCGGSLSFATEVFFVIGGPGTNPPA